MQLRVISIYFVNYKNGQKIITFVPMTSTRALARELARTRVYFQQTIYRRKDLEEHYRAVLYSATVVVERITYSSIYSLY